MAHVRSWEEAGNFGTQCPKRKKLFGGNHMCDIKEMQKVLIEKYGIVDEGDIVDEEDLEGEAEFDEDYKE